MSGDYINWDDPLLDIDGLLEGEFTDDDFNSSLSSIDEDELLDLNEDDYSSESDGDLEPTEYRSPSKKRAPTVTKKPAGKEHKCADCTKAYKTITGYKKHIHSQHGRKDVHVSECSDIRVPASTSNAKDTKPSQPKETSKDLFLASWLEDNWDTSYANSISKTLENPDHNAGYSRCGGQVLNVARKLKGDQEFKLKLKDIISDVLIEANTTTFALIRENICANIHTRVYLKLMEVNELNKLVESIDTRLYGLVFVRAAILEIATNCVQHLVTVMGESLQKKAIDKLGSLSDNEQQVLMYIAGYMLRALQNICRRYSKNAKYIPVNTILKQLVRDNDGGNPTYLSKYRNWQEAINRGGLTSASDNFFLLVRHLEICVSDHLSTHVLGPKVLERSKLTEIVLQNHYVILYWEKLIGGKSSSDSGILTLELLIKTFLSVRGHTLAKFVKNKLSKSNKGEKGLRKSLKNLTNIR
ncbi:unnamed protein product [Owenia fusiformis]|uniref:Uncharacterized protein n=1 Tax=Owenia fusiformis TaxID=6347 RepID=A0A8J1U916_OWEFU|nr:unnamed protein product [Owenia fusiformis]